MRSVQKKATGPKEYSPRDKVPLAVNLALKANSPEGFLEWQEKCTIKDLSVHAKSSDNKGYASNQYLATGEVLVRQHKLEGDRYLPAKTRTFKIEFEDVKDSIGLPDLSIKKFECN